MTAHFLYYLALQINHSTSKNTLVMCVFSDCILLSPISPNNLIHRIINTTWPESFYSSSTRRIIYIPITTNEKAEQTTTESSIFRVQLWEYRQLMLLISFVLLSMNLFLLLALSSTLGNDSEIICYLNSLCSWLWSSIIVYNNVKSAFLWRGVCHDIIQNMVEKLYSAQNGSSMMGRKEMWT